MIQTITRIVFFVIIFTGLNACGFHLRGSGTGMDTLKNSKIHIQAAGAGSLAGELNKQLQYAGITTVASASDADYVIKLSNEVYDRRVLSISPRTGKAEEFEISYKATLAIDDTGGETLLVPETISAVRDYVFDEDAVLGKFTEENRLREDITRHAAASVIRRLQSALR